MAASVSKSLAGVMQELMVDRIGWSEQKFRSDEQVDIQVVCQLMRAVLLSRLPCLGKGKGCGLLLRHGIVLYWLKNMQGIIGVGNFGKVYKGLWKGVTVAYKVIQYPADSIGEQEQCTTTAIMETAISASMSHPNVVQTYSYNIKPIMVRKYFEGSCMDLQISGQHA